MKTERRREINARIQDLELIRFNCDYHTRHNFDDRVRMDDIRCAATDEICKLQSELGALGIDQAITA